MPDLRQALRDFVATSNSGKYATEQELMSKFPELKGYDIQALKDFVATSNSGQYATEEELFSKFPEFNQGATVKKKFGLDSSSAAGSSVSQESAKKKFSIGELREQPNVVSRDATFVNKPKINISKKEIKNIEERKKEDETLQFEKKKYEDIFDKQLNIKPKVEESKYLKDRLSSVNTELINREEEYVVPELQYQFGDLGFKFEESGATGDYVKVTAPNGKTTEISLDNFLSSKSKTQSELLQNFIKNNTPAKGLFVLEKTIREQDKKFNSQKQVDDSIKAISNEVNNLNARQKQFLAKKSKFEKELQLLGPNPDKNTLDLLEKQRISLNEEMKSILQEEENVKQKSKKLDASVGKYSIAKAKQGTWLGGIQNAIWEGVGSINSTLTSLMIDISGEVNPIVKDGSFKSQYLPALFSNEEATKYAIEGAEKMGLKVPTDRSQESINKFKQSLTQDQLDQIESYVRDKSKKLKKEELLPVMRIGGREIYGDPETTKQWSNLKEQDFWGGAILGLSKSLPAMIGGTGPAGWAQRTAQMYAQVSDGLAQEMEQDPDFKDISENEKLAITLPIGIVGAVLEEVGLKNIKGSQGVINSITLKVLGKAGKGTTAKTFRELVENEVDGMMSKGLLTITAAGAAEFETGAAQELADTGFKALYNEIKDKEMFNTPNSTADLIENVVVAGAQEAVGGFVLGVPTAVSTAFTEKGFLKMDDNTFETFTNMANDDKMQSAYITNLKEKITSGTITSAEAKDQLNNYRNSVGLFRQMPEGLNIQQQKEAMNLLKEKRDLDNFVNGKDPALVVKQKNRINEINDSLTKLTETDAVQEQSTTEIPVQSETGVSETVAEGISEPKPEVVTEQVTQEEITEPLRDVESTAKALNEDLVKSIEESTNTLFPKTEDTNLMVSEAYHKAKEDNSNPELVQAVETLLAPEVTEEMQVEVTEPQTIIEEQAPVEEVITQELNEQDLPGYDRAMSEVEGIIQKSKQRGQSNANIADNVMGYVMGSKIYEDATDVQREALVRDVRKMFGLREKSAPSVAKLFGTIKDIKKVTINEKYGLIKQIKDRAKGARESVQTWKEQSKQFAEELNELVKLGKTTNKQVGVILKKFSNVNIFSEKSMNRFTDYMIKTFNDADYNEKLSNARKTLSSLKKLSKNQDKNGDLRALASEFIKIDPSFVENIDEYNDIANNLKTAIVGSKIRKANVKFADTVNAEDVISYVEKILVDQESKIREEKIQEIQDLLGVDASEFDAKEIDAMLESEDDNRPNDNEKIVRATIKKAFNIYSSVIKEMLSTGTDPFTGEEVTFDNKQRDIIERFIAIDPNKIENAKDALRAIDSLINFMQNKSTAGMLKTIAQYEGVEGGEQAVSEGLKAKRLRKYFIPNLGLVLGQQVTSLPVLFDKMFKGVTRALRVEELIGLSDLINNSSKGESESNKIVKNYVKEFYKRNSNGESFNSLYNDIERGIFAHVFRNVIGNEDTMKKVFDKRKQEVLDAIELLSNKGNESELETAKILQKVYDKILDGSENIQDVRGKVDVNNAKAVEYWIGQWSNKYEEMSDLALNFYNKVLGKDLNFTPDRIKKLQDKVDDVDLDDIQSQFFANTDDVLYDKKSGSLMDKQENRSIPKDMYVDFSFDKKNSNAMNDALTDLYTAFDVAKVGAFLKSKEFKKVFPSSKEANLIDKRIKKFVRLTRKKTPFSNDDISNFLKSADKIAKLGITASLASPAQPFKQTIPVMFSTAMSAGSLGFGIAFNNNFNNWLDDLGFAISNRGVESQAQIDSFNKLIEKAADMPLDKALKFIEKTNDKALKALLVDFDVWIARASFKAYYEQSLKKQGLKSSSIDYSKHKVNKEAANYAQRMVDRQQNISNSSLAGDLFTSDSKSKKTFIKMLMPFSSFRMNQSSRLGADLSTLEYWNTSTKEDKIIALRSLLGYTLESAAYRGLQIGFSLLTYAAAKAIMGGDDEEEDKKTTDNLIKGASQSAFVDTFSPLPLADPFIQDVMSYSVEEIESLMDKPEEERTKLFGSQEQSALKVLGTYGIPLQKAKDLYSLGRLAYTGKYKDNYGKEKEITEDQSDQLKKLIGPLFAASVIGVASPDMTQIVNKSIKAAKKNSAPIDKKSLKQRNPEKYEELFGEGSRNYEIEQMQKERDKEIEDRIKERMNR